MRHGTGERHVYNMVPPVHKMERRDVAGVLRLIRDFGSSGNRNEEPDGEGGEGDDLVMNRARLVLHERWLWLSHSKSGICPLGVV